MAENTVRIESSSTSPLIATTVANPAITGVYSYTTSNVVGVVAANTYLSLFNPIGSGKTITVGGTFISSTSAGGTTVTDCMIGYRTTAASAGTLAGAATIAKFRTTYPNSISEVRTGNPTVTLGAQIAASPPTISATNGSTAVHQAVIPPGLGLFTLAPGEGIALNTAVGDTDQRWNLTIIWAEM